MGEIPMVLCGLCHTHHYRHKHFQRAAQIEREFFRYPSLFWKYLAGLMMMN